VVDKRPILGVVLFSFAFTTETADIHPIRLNGFYQVLYLCFVLGQTASDLTESCAPRAFAVLLCFNICSSKLRMGARGLQYASDCLRL